MTKILIVEDSPTAMHHLRAILENEGFEVQEAVDGLSALSTLNQNTPDLIMLDIGLPGIDGISLCAMIRRRGQFDNVPIIMITGSNKPGDRNLSGLFGAQAYISKPYSPGTVLETIDQHLPVNSSTEREL